MKLKIKKNKLGLNVSQATKDSAGFDIRAIKNYTLIPNEIKLIKTGLFFEIEKGYEVQIRPRSGLALKKGITVLNSPGTIDSDYRDEVGVILINLGLNNFEIKRGDRIAQAVVNKLPNVEIEYTNNINKTNRKGGFGSSGLN